MRREFRIAFSICSVLVSFLMLTIGGVQAASTAKISVDPKVNGAAPTESFLTSIVIANVTDMYAWQFNLTFNPSVLEAVDVVEGPFLQQFGTTMMATPNINNTAGYVFAGCLFLDWEQPGASGSGVLATVSFQVETAGMSLLHFSGETGPRTKREDGMPTPMPRELVDGVFGYPRDLAVTGLVASSSSVLPGESVSLNATIKNKGVVDEICNVTFYRYSTSLGTKTDLAVDSEDSAWVVFAWDTTGVAAGSYTIRAEVSVVSGENDTENNAFSGGTLTIELLHDIAITDLRVSPASVPSGGQVSINVTAFNKGSSIETFSITVTCGNTAIGTKEVAVLAPGNYETLTFIWETKGMASGSYLLTATTSSVLGETNTEDNVFSNVGLEITNPPFMLPMELLAALVAAVVLVAVGILLFMRRRSKKV